MPKKREKMTYRKTKERKTQHKKLHTEQHECYLQLRVIAYAAEA